SALAVSIFAAVFLFLTVEAHGQGANEPELKSRFEAWYNTQSWNGGASYSGVFFDQSIYEDAFDKDYLPMVRFYSAWQPLSNLSLELSLGGLYEYGRSKGISTGDLSEEEYQFYVFPVQGRVRYSFMFDRDQPVVPSVWGGGDWWYFFEKNGDVVEGDKSGYHYGADIGILLDRADPASADTLKKEWNIDNTYLCLGYEHMEVGESEDGLRFSGEVYTVGLRFETYNRPAVSLY
ncbi:MAG: hypothetical protein R6V10_05995, partial [bacterium]